MSTDSRPIVSLEWACHVCPRFPRETVDVVEVVEEGETIATFYDEEEALEWAQNYADEIGAEIVDNIS
jgi:hypothetical protein